MGIIKEKKEQYDQAKALFKKAFALNPSLWVAFEKLTELDEKISLDEI